jgi:hypothetical protein
MGATVHKWNKRGAVAELMIKNNYCYFDLSDASKRVFYTFNDTTATATDAANDLNEQLDGISEGVVIVTIQPDAKKKIHAKEFYFKVTSDAPAISGYNTDYISEKLEAALFRQKIELTQQHERERNQLNETIKSLNDEINSNVINKLLNTPAVQSKLLGVIDKFTGSEPQAAIHGVNEDIIRIQKHIPEPFFNNLLTRLADALDKDATGTIEKLKKIFS